MGEDDFELAAFVEIIRYGVIDLYFLVVTTMEVKSADVVIEGAGLDIDNDEYKVLDGDRCFERVEDLVEVIRDIGVPAVERKCVGCVALKDERGCMRLFNVLYDEIEVIDPDVNFVDPTVTVIVIVEVVIYLGLDVEKTNAVVDPELNAPFDRAAYDTELDLVRVAKLTVVILDANELLELVNIDGALDR